MTSSEKIDQAFLQFAFAIKLLMYFELDKVDKNQFDTDTTIELKRKNINLKNNLFHTNGDLKNAAINNLNITLGATAIILDESLTSAGILNSHADTSEQGQLRTLIYMIRCAYAHNMIEPRWEVRGKYIRTLKYSVFREVFEVNLNELNGKPFDMEQIGGHDVYIQIKDRLITLLP
jgi:hypothetical protein